MLSYLDKLTFRNPQTLVTGYTRLATRLRPMYVQSSCLIAKDRINIVQLVLVVADKSRDQNQSQTGF